MAGTKSALAGVLAAALAAPVAGQEGGFQVPPNSGPVIPVPTGPTGEPGFYTTAEFVMGRPRAVPRTALDASHLAAGRYGSVIAVGSMRPAGHDSAPHLYQQLFAIGDPFRTAAEGPSAHDALLGGVAARRGKEAPERDRRGSGVNR
jgi:hypothetical protein